MVYIFYFSSVTIITVIVLFMIKEGYSERTYYIPLVSIFLLYTFFIGFRDFNVGTDTKVYIKYIQDIEYFDGDYGFLLVYLFKLINFFANDRQSIVLLLFLFSYCVYVFVLCNSLTLKSVCICLLLTSFSFTFFDLFTNAIRQSFGVISFIFYLSLYEKYNRKVLWIIFIPPLFHSSMWILVFFFFLGLLSYNNKKIDKFLLFVIIVLTPLVLFRVDLSVYFYKVIETTATSFSDMKREAAMLDKYNQNSFGSLYDRSFIGIVTEVFISVSSMLIIYFLSLQNRKFILFFRLFALVTILYFLMAGQGWSVRYSYLSLSLLPYIYSIAHDDELINYNMVFSVLLLFFMYFFYVLNGVMYINLFEV